MLDSKMDSAKLMNIVCMISNITFLLIHIIYIFLFLITKAYILAYINIFSSIFYAFMFLLLKFKKHEIFALICGIEITAYMICATIIVGYKCGFQLCLIGLCTLAFVTKYFLKDKKFVINPIIVSAFFLTAYIFLFIWQKFNDPIIEIPDYMTSLLYLSHSIIVFIFCVGFLIILLEYVFKLEIKIRKESEVDKLTQIANRKALNDYYDRLGNQKANYVIAMFDIDGFKKFNDINGHLCGDYVLKEIASIAKNNSLNDFVSRWGGEEFVIISKIEDDLENTYKKIDLIRETIDKYEFRYNNKKLHSTITIGIAVFDNDESLDAWISRADKQLYKGKNNGKNKTIY